MAEPAEGFPGRWSLEDREPSWPGPSCRPSGVALPVVVVLLLALTLLVHGGIRLLRVESLAGRSAGLVLRARLLAEGAVRQAGASALAGLPEPGESSVVLELRPETDARAEVVARRLTREWLLLEGRARAGGDRLSAARSLGRIHWVLDPVARLAAVPAAVESPSLPVGGGIVDGSGVAETPDGWPGAACEPHREAVDSLFPGGDLPAWSRLPPAVDGGSPPNPIRRVPALGLLTGHHLLERARVRPSGTLEPEPEVRLGRCVDDPLLNWGSPGDPMGPCGPRYVVAAGTGPLRLRGGEGQGVLAVAGDLTLDGHRFAGVILAGGEVRLENGAEALGFVRASGPVHVGSASHVRASSCTVLRALSAPAVRGALGRPLALPGGPWIPIP